MNSRTSHFLIGITALVGGFAASAIEPKGPGGNHGQLGNEVRSSKYPMEFYTIVYMKMVPDVSGEPTLKVRHAFFSSKDSKGAPLSRTVVNDQVAALIEGRFRTDEFELGDLPKPIAGQGVPAVTNDFSQFRFGCPARIYVVIDNPNIDFQPNWPVLFSEYGAKSLDETDYKKWKKMDENRTFYNVALGGVSGMEDSDGIPRIAHTKVVYFENHFRKGGIFGDTDEAPACSSSKKEKLWGNYSINFNLKMRTDKGMVIPMVVDPDTGNGTGSPPPVRG